MNKLSDCVTCEINVYPDGKTKAGKPASGYVTINDRIIFLRSSKPFWIAYDAQSKIQLAFHTDKNYLISFLFGKKKEINSVFKVAILETQDFLKKVTKDK